MVGSQTSWKLLPLWSNMLLPPGRCVGYTEQTMVFISHDWVIAKCQRPLKLYRLPEILRIPGTWCSLSTVAILRSSLSELAYLSVVSLYPATGMNFDLQSQSARQGKFCPEQIHGFCRLEGHCFPTAGLQVILLLVTAGSRARP